MLSLKAPELLHLVPAQYRNYKTDSTMNDEDVKIMLHRAIFRSGKQIVAYNNCSGHDILNHEMQHQHGGQGLGAAQMGANAAGTDRNPVGGSTAMCNDLARQDGPKLSKRNIMKIGRDADRMPDGDFKALMDKIIQRHKCTCVASYALVLACCGDQFRPSICLQHTCGSKPGAHLQSCLTLSKWLVPGQ